MRVAERSGGSTCYDAPTGSRAGVLKKLRISLSGVRSLGLASAISWGGFLGWPSGPFARREVEGGFPTQFTRRIETALGELQLSVTLQ